MVWIYGDRTEQCHTQYKTKLTSGWSSSKSSSQTALRKSKHSRADSTERLISEVLLSRLLRQFCKGPAKSLQSVRSQTVDWTLLLTDNNDHDSERRVSQALVLISWKCFAVFKIMGIPGKLLKAISFVITEIYSVPNMIKMKIPRRRELQG